MSIRESNFLPIEVVVRRFADEDFSKRNPEVEKGTRLEDIAVEFFLKTERESNPLIRVKEDYYSCGGKVDYWWKLFDAQSFNKFIDIIDPVCSMEDLKEIEEEARSQFLSFEIVLQFFEIKLQKTELEFYYASSGNKKFGVWIISWDTDKDFLTHLKR